MISILKKLGVDYFQGYYYSKPVNETEILKILEKKNGIGTPKLTVSKKTL